MSLKTPSEIAGQLINISEQRSLPAAIQPHGDRHPTAGKPPVFPVGTIWRHLTAHS